LIFTAATVAAQAKPTGVGPLQFRRVQVSFETFESVAVFDVNKYGSPDLVSGSYWYPGPEFRTRNFIGEVKKHGEFYDDFSTIPIDVNGDGYMDFVTGGWWGNSVRWRENPGTQKKEWAEHIIGETGNVETTRAWDIDRDGTIDIVPNNPGRPLLCFTLDKPGGSFTKHQIAASQGHGLGFGDINGDGFGDMILTTGWLQAPADTWKGEWTMNKEFDLGETGLPVLVVDVNEDGLNDLIAGQGHDYGLHWYEQKYDKASKKRTWLKHPIDPFNSQFHTLMYEDIDGDNKPELITGKRYRGHDDKDPGNKDDYGLYYYKWNGQSFSKQIICYGPPGIGKGTGNYFSVTDLRKNGRKDIVVAGKDGLVIFYNEGLSK
jgi:hypothetical protein